MHRILFGFALLLALLLGAGLTSQAVADPPLMVDGLVVAILPPENFACISIDTSYGTGPYSVRCYFVNEDTLVVGGDLEVGSPVRAICHLDASSGYSFYIIDVLVVYQARRVTTGP